jgi:hypothetical protein
MKPIEFIAQDLFDKIRSRFYNLEMGDDIGTKVTDPRSARFFDFDFVIEGNLLGRVSISINDVGSLKIFYGQGILDKADSIITKMWYDFLREMRLFAKRRMLRFDTRDITKSNLNKADYGYLAKNGSKEQTMKESSMYGSSKSSYKPVKNGTRLIIRHSGPIQTETRGSRRRNIKSIYIENREGERYKMPFNHMATAEALAMHVNEGGRPYDARGQAITKMGESVMQLASFKRQVGSHDSMNSEANAIYERACQKLESLRTQLGRLSKPKYYQEWSESFYENSDQLILDQATLEDYKSKFTVNTFNEELAQYFPLIHSIMQEAGTIDLDEYTTDVNQTEKESADVGKVLPEFAQFESWINSIAEETDDESYKTALINLLKNDKLSLGVDENNVIKSLQNIGIEDSELTDALESLARVNSDADPVPIIMAWVEKDDPDIAAEISRELDIKADTTMPSAASSQDNPPPEPDMDAEPEMGAGPEMRGKRPPSNLPNKNIASEASDETKTSLGSDKDIEEMVKSFYDKETGNFPIGETAVVIKVEKQFNSNPNAGAVAKKCIEKLTSDQHDAELSRIAELSGTAMHRVNYREAEDFAASNK